MSFEVNCRVQSVDNYRGTVRYVGIVSGANPSDGWIGVEWDTIGRGKHDGSFQGNRYFSCPDGKGSFVRQEMLLKAISFQDALINKYASADAANVDESMSFREARKNKAAVVCELVGKDREVLRMGKLELLKEVTLPCALIASVGDELWLNENVSGIISLELEDNLISDWSTVATLAAQLTNLSKLALSGNKFQPMAISLPAAPLLLRAFSNIKCLVLNATGVNFQQIDILKDRLPQLADLHLANNQISSTDPDSSRDSCKFAGWPNLQCLELSDNYFSSWKEINRLSHFRELRRLILNGNLIEHISLPALTTSDETTDPEPFAKLGTLALANNKIETWDSMHVLRSLTQLNELRVQGNPFCEGTGPAVTRQLLIATISTLSVLNGGEIRARERIEAEKFYVRHALNRGAGTAPDVLAGRDGVLAALLQKHGVPDDLPTGNAKAAGGAQGMVPVRLRSMAAESSHKAPVTRRLPASVTVGNIKRLCLQFFGLDVARQRLFAQNLADSDAWAAEPMEDDLKPLSYYLGDAGAGSSSSGAGAGAGAGDGGVAIEILMQEADESMARSEAEGAAVRRRAAEERQAAAIREAQAHRTVQEAEVQAGKRAAAAAAAAATSGAPGDGAPAPVGI